MDMRDQKWSTIGYWAGVVAFAVSPNAVGILVGWGITVVTTIIASG